jgi:O-antigen biosynthesis protein
VSDTESTGGGGARPSTSHGHARVVAWWDETATARAIDHRQGWLDSPLVFREVFQARVAGAPNTNWIEGLMVRAGIPKAGRWASLGCGAGGEEIKASKLGLYGSLAAFDASRASLDLAQHAAAEAGVTNLSFDTIDNNRFSLPAGAFDVVMMNMSLHHVREIRAALEAVRRALAPGGFLLLNEFVGARQFQFPEAQLEAVRTLLAALPEPYRKDSTTGLPKTEYVRMPVEHWNVADPSEAVRSDLILPEVERLFEIVVRADYGGTILNPLLEHLIHNFDPLDEKDAALVRVLAAAEALLIDSGVLPNDFTAIAARPLDAAREVPARGIAPPSRLRPLALSSPLGNPADLRKIDKLTDELAAMYASRGWKLLQALRGLVGRRW